MEEMINFYKELLIKEDASDEEIISAYEKRKRIYEQRNRDDYVNLVTLAKDVLLDPKRRAEHNEDLKRGYIGYKRPNNYDENILDSITVWKDRLLCEENLNKDANKIKTNIKILTIIILIASIIIVPGLRWNVLKELFFVSIQLFRLLPVIIEMVIFAGAIGLICAGIYYFALCPIKNMFKSFKNINKTNKELKMMKKK